MANDINITSVGSFSAGEYNHIRVMGSGTCTGQTVTAQQIDIMGAMKFAGSEKVKANRFTCPGACTVSGKLEAESGTVNGKLTVGEIDAESFLIRGHVTARGTVEVKAFNLSGILNTNGMLQCEQININGKLDACGMKSSTADVSGCIKLSGPAEAECVEVDGVLKASSGNMKNLHADGYVEIKEKLVCGDLKGKGEVRAQNIESDTFIHGGSVVISEQLCADKIVITGCIHAKEIVGDQINIGRKDRPFKAVYRGLLGQRKFSDVNIDSEANLIEATKVELYRVRAKQVNGQDIIIGEKCEIDHVDCSGTLSIASDAVVGKITGSYQVI